MRHHGCRYATARIDGHDVMVLENRRLRVSVLPGQGADIVEFRHKPSDLDLLWHGPRARPPGGGPTPWAGSPETRFMHAYFGGWQELFPTCGDAGAYGGMPMGVHGEVAFLPWRWRVVADGPAEVSIAFETETVLAPFRLRRVMSLRDDRATLYLDERVEHVGAEPAEFMWGHHPTFGAPFLKEGCRIDTDATTILTTSHHHDEAGVLAADRRAAWPHAPGRDGGSIDLSVVPGPDRESHDWAYLAGFERGWLAIREPEAGIGFACRWPAEVMPYLLFWQNYRGARGAPWHGRAYVVGLEPQSTFPASHAHGRPTLRLGAGEVLRFRLTATAFQRDGPVASLDEEGLVA